MNFPHSKSEFPVVKHYVILRFGSVHIPGDERSRTNPGHGYPEHDEATVQYAYTLDREEWIREIQILERTNHREYVAFESHPVTIVKRVEIEVRREEMENQT